MQRDRNHTGRIMIVDEITVSRKGNDITAAFKFGTQSIMPISGSTMDQAVDKARMAVVGAHFHGTAKPTYDHVKINLVGLSVTEGNYFAKGMSSVYAKQTLNGGQQ